MCSAGACEPTWLERETVGGYYGREWALEAAADLLADARIDSKRVSA